MRAVKGKAELAFSFPRIYLHLFYCVFIHEAQHNQESLFIVALVAPLRGFPALALLALLVAHHVEVPLLAISVAATTRTRSQLVTQALLGDLLQLWKTSSRSSSILSALAAVALSTHSPLTPTLPGKKRKKEVQWLVLMLNHPQDRRTVQPRTELRLYIRLHNPTGSFDLLVPVVAP